MRALVRCVDADVFHSYEPIGSRNGVLKDTRDGYEMIKVSSHILMPLWHLQASLAF